MSNKELSAKVSMSEHAHVSAGVQDGQKRKSDSLELDPQAVVNHLIWVQDTGARAFASSSTRA